MAIIYPDGWSELPATGAAVHEVVFRYNNALQCTTMHNQDRQKSGK